MRSFYIRYVLHPLIMFQVKHMPLFLDYCYLYLHELQHQVQKKLMQPDYIEQVRITLADKRK